MGSGIMQYWVNGKICVGHKIQNAEYPFKNQPSSIPLFHYSIFEASVKASKNAIYFHLSCKIAKMLNSGPYQIR